MIRERFHPQFHSCICIRMARRLAILTRQSMSVARVAPHECLQLHTPSAREQKIVALESHATRQSCNRTQAREPRTRQGQMRDL